MRHLWIPATFFLAFGGAVVSAPDSLLHRLSLLLEQSRKTGEVQQFECPESTDSLVGLLRSQILSVLKSPNLSQDSSDAEYEEIKVDQYFFAPASAQWVGLSVPTGEYSAVAPLGEFFVVLQLHYDSGGKVVRARCYDEP
jgi:hypothetical protein